MEKPARQKEIIMQKFSFKRLTAWLLTFVMLVSIVPANVSAATWEDVINSFFTFPQFQSSTEPSATAGNTAGTYGLTRAAGETTYVLAGSDFQASNHDAGATIVSGLLDKIKVDYPTMNGFLFAGDYDVNYSDPAGGKAKLQNCNEWSGCDCCLRFQNSLCV